MKNTIRTLLITMLVALGFSGPTTAAPILSAQSVFSRVSEAFNKISGYQSTSHFTIFKIDTSDKSIPEPGFDVNETVERPNKLSLVTTQDSHVGVLVLTDGTNLTVFNAPKLTFVKSTSGADYNDLLSSVRTAAGACLTSSQDGQLQVSLTIPFMFYRDSVEIASGPPHVSRQVVATVVPYLGKRAIQLIQSFVFPNRSRVDYALLIDPTTNLPLSFSQYAVTSTGTYLPIIRQEYSKFIPINQPLPLTGYSFLAPPGSVEVTN